MKLLSLKLIALVVLLGGLLFLGLALDLDQAWNVYNTGVENWPAKEADELYFGIPGIALGALIVLVGLYAFLPRLPSSKNKYITQDSPDGTLLLELAPLRKSLLKVMRTMPEVAKIKVQVQPDRSRKRACVIADVILNSRKDFSEELSAKRVASTLAVTCKEVLGFEDNTAVLVNVRGVRFDVEETSKKVREHLQTLETERKESCCDESSATTPPALPAETEAEKCCEEAVCEDKAEDTTAAEETVPAVAEESVTEAEAEDAPAESDVAEVEAVPEKVEEPCCAQEEVAEVVQEETPAAVEEPAEESVEEEVTAEEVPAAEERVEEEPLTAEAEAVEEATPEEESSDAAPAPLSTFSLPPLTQPEEEDAPLTVTETALPAEEAQEEEIPDALPEAVEEAPDADGNQDEDKPEEKKSYW